MASKGSTQFRHCIKRAIERYGITLTKDKYQSAIKQIRSGASTFLYAESHSRKIHIVLVDDIKCKVIYDPTRRSLRTFLPK